MTILITKQNQEFIQSLIPATKLKFVEETKNTTIFNLSEKKFLKLRNEIREKGLNPYALMYW